MRLWWEVARRGFARYATYRWATFAGVFTNTIFGFMRAYVLFTLFRYAPEIAGFTKDDIATYSFLTQGLIMPLYLWGWYEISDTVYSGQVATDLYRPFDYQLYWLSLDLGRAVYHAVLRGIPPFVIGALAFDLRVPQEPGTWIAFTLAVLLAICVSFAMRFMVNLTSFWLIDIRGVQTLAAAVWTVLSGFIIPLALLRDPFDDILRILPFAAMIEIPVDVFLERVRGAQALGALASQLAWALVLLGAGRIVLARATRKLVVQGG